MDRITDIEQNIPKGEFTEMVIDQIINVPPLSSNNPKEIQRRIQEGLSLLETEPRFLEGVSQRLTQLGVECDADDQANILSEIKQRYKSLLGFECPRAVIEWIKGTRPSFTNPKNNYDLCFALEMDFEQVVAFFQKFYLVQPFNVKSKIDAVFMYAFFHRKPYSVVQRMLEESSGFLPQEKAHTSTSQIMVHILNEDDDDAFLKYLSLHCYDNEQQYQRARERVQSEIEGIKNDIEKKAPEHLSNDRLNSKVIEYLLGYNYQSERKSLKGRKYPKIVTESIPNDVTLGRIMRGEKASYHLLRKTLILAFFYNFFTAAEAEAMDAEEPKSPYENYDDFYVQINAILCECGLAQLHECNPFDLLILFCAYSDLPILTLYEAIATPEGN